MRIVKRPRDFPWSSQAQPLGYLTDAHGEELTAETHARCPGEAAIVDEYGQITYLCLHPKQWGHRTPLGYTHLTEEEAAQHEKDQAAARERAEAWAVASRRGGRGSRSGSPPRARHPPAPSAPPWSSSAATDCPSRTGHAAAFLGANESAAPEALYGFLGKVTDARLPLVAMAYVAAAAEDNLDQIDRRWQYQPDLAVRWLDQLTAWGYRLTDPEQHVRDQAAAVLADQDNDSDRDRDQDGEDDEVGEVVEADGLAGVDPDHTEPAAGEPDAEEATAGDLGAAS